MKCFRNQTKPNQTNVEGCVPVSHTWLQWQHRIHLPYQGILCCFLHNKKKKKTIFFEAAVYLCSVCGNKKGIIRTKRREREREKFNGNQVSQA